jgi:hypothetical protein
MGEIPDHPKSDQIVMIAQAKPDATRDTLFNRTYGDSVTLKNNPVISTGQIQSLTVPDGWIKRADANLRAGAGLVEYHPPGHDDIRLNSFYRGNRVSNAAAQAFKDCLAKPPHQLQSGSKELKDLAEVLGDKAYDFDVLFAQTAELNGKRVLWVQGNYTDKKHTGAQTIYVDSDGTGSAVQEISYSASGHDYAAHLTEAQKALKSVVWK